MKTIYSPESLELCEWLRTQRLSQGLTMRQAGEILNKPHSFIAKTETGQRRLDVIEFVWYCQCLKFNPINGLLLIINK